LCTFVVAVGCHELIVLRLDVLVGAVAENPDRAGERNDGRGKQPKLYQHVMEPPDTRDHADDQKRLSIERMRLQRDCEGS
jgi:hypothetical protein